MSQPEPAATTVAPPPVPADVGVVAALPIEVGALQLRLHNVRKYSGPKHTIVEGDCGAKVVALIVAGVGQTAARRGAELLLAGHRPRWIISAGFAGALDPELRRNDLVLVTRVVSEDAAAPGLDIDVNLLDVSEGAWRSRAGRLVTATRIIRTAAEKAEVRRQFESDLVDMESYPVASLCMERAVRWLGVRIISDEASTDLPPRSCRSSVPRAAFAWARPWVRSGGGRRVSKPSGPCASTPSKPPTGSARSCRKSSGDCRERMAEDGCLRTDGRIGDS